MGSDQIFVRQVKPRQADCSGNHQLLTAEEILVMRVPRGAVGQDKSRLARSTGSATPLGIVRRGRRHVPHVDHVELADVDAELHGGRAIKDGELAGAEILLAFLPLFVRHLGRVLVGLESPAITSDGAIELDEERIGAATVVRQVRDADGIVKRPGSFARMPGHAGRRDAVAWNSIVGGRSLRFDDELSFCQDPEEVDADLVTVLDAELLPVPFELRQNPLAAQVLAKAAPS